MIFYQRVLLFLLILSLLLLIGITGIFAVPAPAAVVQWNVNASGNWNTPGNWNTGNVPIAGDDVILRDPTPGGANITITLDVSTANLNSLTIQDANVTLAQGGFNVQVNNGGAPDVTITAGTWTQGTGVVTVGRNFANNGGTFTGGSGAIGISGTFTNAAGRTFTSTSSTLTVTGGFTNSGTFTHNSGTLVLNGAGAQAFNPGSSDFNNVTISNGGTTSLNINSLTLAGELNVTGGELAAGALNVTVNGNTSISNGVTLSAITGVLTLGDALADTIILSGGTISTSGAATLDFNGAFSATGASNLNLNTATTLQIGGSFALANVTESLGTLTGNPAVIFDGTTLLTPQAGTTWPHTRIDGTVTQAGFDMELAAGKNLTFNGGTLTVSIGLIVPGTTTLSSVLTFSGGTSTLTGLLTVGTGDTVNFNGGTVNILGGITNTGAGVFNTNAACTVNLDATPQSMTINGTGDIALPTTWVDSDNTHGNVVITVAGVGTGAFRTLDLSFGGTGDKITTSAREVNVMGNVNGTDGELETTGGATLNFDGSVGSVPVTLDLHASTILRFAGDLNLNNVAFASTALENLTGNPAVIFDGNTKLWSNGNSWPHVNVNDGDGTLASTVTLQDDFTCAATKTLDVQMGTFNVQGNTLTMPKITTIGRNIPPAAAADTAELRSAGKLDFNEDVVINDTGTLRATEGTITFLEQLLSTGRVKIEAAATVTNEETHTNGDSWKMAGGPAADPDKLGTFIINQGKFLTIKATVAGQLTTVPGTTTVESATLQLADVGDLTLVGTLIFNDRSLVENIGTGTLTIMCDLTIIPGAQFRNMSTGQIRFEGEVLNQSTINMTAGTRIYFAKLINVGIIVFVDTNIADTIYNYVEGELLNNGVIYIGSQDGTIPGTLEVGLYNQ